MTTHNLKTWPAYYNRVISGDKTFEVRKNDRDFQVGDMLSLEYFDPKNPNGIQPYNEPILVQVIYILHGPNFGIQEGYCVMGIRKTNTPIEDFRDNVAARWTS